MAGLRGKVGPLGFIQVIPVGVYQPALEPCCCLALGDVRAEGMRAGVQDWMGRNDR